MYTQKQIVDLLNMRLEGYYVTITTKNQGDDFVSAVTYTPYKKELWSFDIPLCSNVLRVDVVLQDEYKLNETIKNLKSSYTPAELNSIARQIAL